MTHLKTVAVLLIVCVIMIPTVSAHQTVDNKKFDLDIHGGFGVHFRVKNNLTDILSVNYTVLVGSQPVVEEHEFIVLPGKTVYRTERLIAPVARITAMMATEGEVKTKNGFIIGFFVILW